MIESFTYTLCRFRIISHEGGSMISDMEKLTCKSRLYCDSCECKGCTGCELQSDAFRDDVRELVAMCDDISCTCHEAYKTRELNDPECPRCNWIDDETVDKVRSHLGEEK